MPSIAELFPGSLFRASDFPEPRQLQIASISQEEVGQEQQVRVVVRFQNDQRGWVLNKTCAAILSDAWGDDYTSWYGRWVELYATTTQLAGRQVPCIRVRPEQAADAAPPVPPPPPRRVFQRS